MRVILAPFAVAGALMVVLASNGFAVRVMTNPATAPGDPALQFNNIALTPDGTTIVANGLFNNTLTGDRVYSLAVPANPATDTATITQLSTSSFLVNLYDVAFAPVISPDGQTILFTHDGNSLSPPTNTIYTMPITGELNANSFTGLFGNDPNLVAPGNGNATPVFSPNGATIYFLNSEAGFGGTGAIPDFDNPTLPNPWADAPDWDVLYSVPAGGGTPTAVTSAADGDIDVGLYTVTPDGSSVIYAPDNPISERKDRGDTRPKLFSVPSGGGASTEITLTPPGHEFTITNQLALTPNGQNVLFLADYETIGKHELFSVPIGGGTPTRISDDLPFAGDVYSFAVAPNGTHVAYAAGQNTSSNTELFLTPITGGTGNSIRVSDPIAENNGLLDVSTASDGGQIVFSPDSSQIFFLGDLDTEDVNDLYVVDTTQKAGLVPTSFVFVGPANGNFFDEANWEDADGNNPAADTINPNVPVRQSLVIDGDSVVATASVGDELTFQLGGSLELTPGSSLTSTQVQLEFNPGSGLKLTDATISVREDVRLSGTNVLSGGEIASLADDIEFEDNHDSIINGTTFRSGNGENIFFDSSADSITGATFVSDDRLGLRYEVDVTVTDTQIDVNGGLGDVEDIFGGINSPAQGQGSTLTLRGTSTLLANTIEDGVDLVLEGASVATLLGVATGTSQLVDRNGTSTITVNSAGAEIVISNASDFDPRALIINGLSGDSYLADPSAWNVNDWNGLTPLASLRLLTAPVDGDYNNDGFVNAADYAVWRDNLGSSVVLPNDPTPGSVTNADYDVWRNNFGATGSGSATTLLATVPEPGALHLLLSTAIAIMLVRSGYRRLGQRVA